MPHEKTVNIFAAPEATRPNSPFDLDKLADRFKSNRNTDWSVPEAFLCLLMSAAFADGSFALEEQAETYALARRSRVLKSVSANELARANDAVSRRLRERPNALQEACASLPSDMCMPLFAHCADIILADGSLASAEADFLNQLVGYLDLDADAARRVLEVLILKNRF